MKRLFLLCCAWLAGCASTPAPAPPPVPADLFADAAFAAPTERVGADDLFALNDAMRAFIRTEGKPTRDEPDLRRHLVDMLYRKHKLALEYDATLTRTAAQAFDARAGNCLSLVIMTAAFAKAMDLPVRYQTVSVEDALSRSGSLVFASGHVNLTLDIHPLRSRWDREFDAPLVVDFLPADELRGRRMQPLAERTVVAMFMNNRAAETLSAGRVDDAYWWARGAIEHDPTFLTAHNTLGVIYLRHGLAARAVALFEHLLEREPDNAKVMGNLAQALRQDGRHAAADAVAQRLARLEPHPPFHFLDAGVEAMAQRDYARARDLFQRELRREAYFHETHFRLAQALLALGDTGGANEHLEAARQYSTTLRDQALYASKLARLRAATALPVRN